LNFQADIAQLVEQRIRNAQVSGSIPLVGSIILHPRVSYSGYYAAFPRPRGEFDSLYPHHVLTQKHIRKMPSFDQADATIQSRVMTIPKKYLHDRLILLLLSISTFLAFLNSLWVLFKLDSGRSSGYIVQYRGSLGISALKTGDASELVAFIGFALLVLVFHVLMSIKAYHIRREVSVAVLGFGVILLVLSLVVSNALLSLR
jgi:hypothetical protein